MTPITSTDKDFAQLLKDHQRVIVKYYADWCGSCKLFSPKYKRMAGESDNESVVFLDVNAEENPEARKAAGVDTLPFFATFYEGKLVEGTGTSKEDYVIEMIERLKSK